MPLIYKQRAFSTVKVYLAAIAACHVGFGWPASADLPFHEGCSQASCVGQPLASLWLVPPWDQAVVLEGLKGPPFEPLQGADLKFVSLKTMLLLALALANRVSDIHVLSVHPSCAQLFPADGRMTLKPNPAFVPKVGPGGFLFSH